MKYKDFFRILIKSSSILLLILAVFLSSCNDDFFVENPTTQLSEAFFWQNEKHAHQALMGCYRVPQAGWTDGNGWSSWTPMFDSWTDIAVEKLRRAYPYNGLQSNTSQVQTMWRDNYSIISKCNYFLGNIEKVEMDGSKKAEMVAEVKFLRGYAYYWLSQLFGNIPLTKELLTFDEANNITQSPKEEVVNFILNELTDAASDLPVKRPDGEYGRIEKGAALALKGRLLMAEKRWSEAAKTFEEIVGLNRYKIDTRFKKLFEDEGDNSDEIIFSKKYIENNLGDGVTQRPFGPAWYGRYGELYVLQNFVDKFLMTDGMPITQSPLYDANHPFENRDPRLYATVLLPDYSVVNGKMYRGHPDSIAATRQGGPGVSGYAANKFFDADFSGNFSSYGGDYKLIRYAEILLNLLESKLEARENITQNLLDNTINQIRNREEVKMPPVTETDVDKLREIVRNERCIELALEGGIRYFDLLRWGELHTALNKKFYGVKITDNPDNYDGGYIINDQGHIFVCEKIFLEHYYLWPIPLRELDVNKNLKQNPGYN